MRRNPNGWMPHFSPSGKICSGVAAADPAISGAWAEGVQLETHAWTPRWVDDNRVVMIGGGGVIEADTTNLSAPHQLHSGAYNTLAAGGGTWWGWRAGGGVYRADGTLLDAAGADPWAARNGDLVYPQAAGDNVYAIAYNGKRIVEPTLGIAEVRTEQGIVVWSQYVTRYARITYGWKPDLRGPVPLGVLDPVLWPELRSIPFRNAAGHEFVYTATHFGFFIRPWGRTSGWVHHGEIQYPDVICINDIVYIVGSDGQGRPILESIALSEPMVDIVAAVAPPRPPVDPPKPPPDPEPEPEPMQIDWSDFLGYIRQRWAEERINERSEDHNEFPEGSQERENLVHRNKLFQARAFFGFVAEYRRSGRPHAKTYGILRQDPGRSNVDGFSEDYATQKVDGVVYSTDVIGSIGSKSAGVAHSAHPTREARQDAWAEPPDGGTHPPPPPDDDLEACRVEVQQLQARIDELQSRPVTTVTYEQMASLVDDANSAYVRGKLGKQQKNMPPMTTMHLFWRFFVEGYERDALIEEARRRGNDEPFD